MIEHSPNGAAHPYYPTTTERTPHDPVDGDMVTLGFAVHSSNDTTTVVVTWMRNGRPQPPLHGRPIAQRGTVTQYLVELGTLTGGDTVRYQIAATSDATTVQTDPESFVVRQWHRVMTMHPTDQGWITHDEHGSVGLPLVLMRTADPAGVQLTVGAAVDEAHPPSPAPQERAGFVQVNHVRGQLELQTLHGDVRPLRLRWLEEDGRMVAIEVTGPLADDEALLGFGERFDAVNQRGRAPDVQVYEQYKNQGTRTYLPIPFFCSNHGYGCLVEGTTIVHYDMGRTIPDRWRCVIATDRSETAQIVFFTGTPQTIVRAMTALTGRPTLPPAWAFGPWMSSNEWNTQARVEAEVAATLAADIPATALVIEAWSDETTFYTWNGADYAPRAGDAAPQLADFTFPADGPWPNPKQMVDQLHTMGIRVLLWQIPALKQITEAHSQHERDVACAVEQGLVLHNADGTPYRNPFFWFNQALIPDFTSPKATTWWLAKRAYLIDAIGIDGFKTDGGEHLAGRTVCAADGRRGGELINAYPNLYIGAYHHFVAERTAGDGLTFSRAGHTGAGAFAAHWAGDENSSWEAFQRSIIAGLSAGMSGVSIWGWDIAGFSEALPSAELYLRSTAMAAFCPVMQYHSEYTPPGALSKDRTPWHIQRSSGDARVVPGYRFFANLRMNLLPYILREAAHGAATGEPLLRSLCLDNPDDPVCWQIEDQYRFGRDLLVAPVVIEGASERTLYLPAGTWYDFWTAAPVQGGAWITVAAPLDRLPVFVRAAAVVPLHLGVVGALGDPIGQATMPVHGLTLRIYPEAVGTVTLVDAVRAQTDVVLTRTDTQQPRITVPPLPYAVHLDGPEVTPTTLAPSLESQTCLLA